MTALVADSSLFPAVARSAGFRGAFSVSVVLHVLLIGGTALALSWPRAIEDEGVEAIAVDIVTLEEFSSSTPNASVQSSATEAMLSAGVRSVAAVAPEAVAPEVPVENATPVTAEAVPAKPAPVQPAAPVEIVASLTPLAAVATPAAPTDAIVPLKAQSSATEQVASVAAQSVKPLPDEQPKPVEKQPVKAVTPPDKKKRPGEKPSTASSGNGGSSDADAAASASASAGKGKSGAAGNAAVDKYPGVVQRQLRRALRFPKGAGRARGEVHVQFLVSASGGASAISVVRSSGEPAIDQAAIATVERAAPFPPIPPEAGRTSWTFTIPLHFSR